MMRIEQRQIKKQRPIEHSVTTVFIRQMSIHHSYDRLAENISSLGGQLH